MKIPVIKSLVESTEVGVLHEAEEAILEGQSPSIEIKGDDEGEQLTHVMAALWIKEAMESEGIPFAKALRNYTQKVRKSIS